MPTITSSVLVSSAVLKNGGFATVWKETTKSKDSYYKVVWATDSGSTAEKFLNLKRNADRFLKDRCLAYSVKGSLIGKTVAEQGLGSACTIVGTCPRSGHFILELSDGSMASVSPLQCRPV
jgi:hypothetical protein